MSEAAAGLNGGGRGVVSSSQPAIEHALASCARETCNGAFWRPYVLPVSGRGGRSYERAALRIWCDSGPIKSGSRGHSPSLPTWSFRFHTWCLVSEL